MLAKLLRFTMAMQLGLGAALGYCLSGMGAISGHLLAIVLTALAMPVLGNLCTTFYGCLRSRADEPAHLWWRALLGESWTGLRVFVLHLPWAFAAPVIQPGRPQDGAPARIPVLLVHGLVCNHRVWDSLVPALRAQGHSVLAIDLEPLFTPIDDYAAQVEQAVQALCQHSGQSRVALVGHSMGGVVIRAWMRRYGNVRVARVLTLGTPHAGTRAKPLVMQPNIAQMAWQSAWLAELAASETEATRRLMRIALSPQDNVVYPQRAQTLAGVTPTVLEGMGHLQLCLAQKARLWVCAELALL